MQTADLLSWANTTDVITIPAIEQDVVELQGMQSATSALLSSKVQEFGDTLAAHAISLDVNFSASEVANTRSYEALSQLYDINLRVTTEVAAAMAQLRGEISTQFDSRDATFGGTVKGEILLDVDATVAVALADMAVEASRIDAVSATVAQSKIDILAAVDGVLDTTLPMLNSMQGVVLDQANATDNAIAVHLSGFTKPTLLEGLDQVMTDTGAMVSGLRTEYEAAVAGVNSNLATNYYTIAATDSAIATAGLILSGQIGSLSATLTNDYYTIVEADGAISIATTNLKSLMESPSGSVGSISANLTTNYYTKTQADSAVSASTLALKSSMEGPGGSVYVVSAAAQAASDLAGSKGKVLVQSTAPVAADRVAQNLWIDTTGGNNTPKRWVSGTTWAAVTDKAALDAAAAASAAQAYAEGVSANLTTNYMTTTTTNSAIAAATLNLKSSLEATGGSIYETTAFAQATNANLTTNYLTSTQVGQAISSYDMNLNASIGTISSAVDVNTAAWVDFNGKAASMYAIQAKAGGGVGSFEVMAWDGIGGAGSAVKIKATDIILEGTVTTEALAVGSVTAANLIAGAITSDKMNVDWLNAGRLSAEYLDVNTLLTIQPNAGFSYQKNSIGADAIDGLYFGYDGNKFGFSASRTDGVSGRNQSLKISSSTGLQLFNAKHFVRGTTLPVTTGVTVTTAKAALPAGNKTIAIQCVGGGQTGSTLGSYTTGPAQGQRNYTTYPGVDGQATTVNLYDGVTLMHTFTSAGGTSGAGSAVATPLTPNGNGGAGQRVDWSYSTGGETNDSSYTSPSGKSAIMVSSDVIDISAWADPQIEVTILTGGMSNGKAVYSLSAEVNIPADVVPLVPQAIGTFSKPSSYTQQSFPDLGAGLWCISSLNGATSMNITSIAPGPEGLELKFGTSPAFTFISSQTPTYIPTLTGRTISYAFYSMGSWG